MCAVSPYSEEQILKHVSSSSLSVVWVMTVINWTSLGEGRKKKD